MFHNASTAGCTLERASVLRKLGRGAALNSIA
jgi:hypothetical protein